MTDWSLPHLLAGLHDDIERRLATARKAFGHPGTKGDASESVWLQLFQTYLPQRYQAASAHVVDSKGTFSDQIDVVLFDRQYSPFIFQYEGQTIVSAESVYAVFEAKQAINAGQIDYVRLWENICMSEKRTKADKAQREADQLEEKSSRRAPQNQEKKHVRISAKRLCGS